MLDHLKNRSHHITTFRNSKDIYPLLPDIPISTRAAYLQQKRAIIAPILPFIC
jgi:hypothetical protein